MVRAVDEAAGRGVIDSILCTDGTDYDKLFVPGAGFNRRPYIDPPQLERGDHIPVMDGRYVFKMATTHMAEAATAILERNRVGIGDVKMVLMHQANQRINEYVQNLLADSGREGLAQHSQVRQHDRRHRAAPLGRVRARRPGEARRPGADGGLRGRNALGSDPARRVTPLAGGSKPGSATDHAGSNSPRRRIVGLLHAWLPPAELARLDPSPPPGRSHASAAMSPRSEHRRRQRSSSASLAVADASRSSRLVRLVGTTPRAKGNGRRSRRVPQAAGCPARFPRVDAEDCLSRPTAVPAARSVPRPRDHPAAQPAHR